MRQYFVITNEVYIYIKIIIKLSLPFLRLIIISHLFSLFSILFPIHLKHNCKQTCAWLACLQFNSNSFTQRKNTLWPQKCISLISIRSLTDFHSIGYRQTRKSRGWWNSSPRIGKKKKPLHVYVLQLNTVSSYWHFTARWIHQAQAETDWDTWLGDGKKETQKT